MNKLRQIGYTYSKMKFPTKFTIEFIEQCIKPSGKRILDVGCGEGNVAYELKKRGAIITAIDIDAKVIPLALQKGIKVVQDEFINIKGMFDVLIFSRSLHHMTDLNAAISKATRVLDKKAMVILEEFDYTNIDTTTATWFYSTLAHLKESRLLKTEITIPEDALEKWNESHDHEPHLNSGNDMVKAIKSKFSKIKEERVPYLFRYIDDLLIQNQDTAGMIERIYGNEKELIDIGRIMPLGIRITAFN